MTDATKSLTWDGDGSTPIVDLNAVRRLMNRPPSPPVHIVSPAQAENLRRIEAWLRGGELEPTR